MESCTNKEAEKELYEERSSGECGNVFFWGAASEMRLGTLQALQEAAYECVEQDDEWTRSGESDRGERNATLDGEDCGRAYHCCD